MEKNTNVAKTDDKEEGTKMKMIAIALMAALCVVFYTSAEAATTDKTVSVTASGSITGATALSVTPASITFGTTSVDAYPTIPADSKIKITYSSNYNPWKMRIYTNNTQVALYDPVTKLGMIAKGGLATAAGKAVVPCKWVAKVGTSASVPTLAVYKAGSNYVKDLRDQDDPATVDDPAVPGVQNDESWATSDAQGYTNIAYGGPGGGYCIDPLNQLVGHENEGDAITPTTGVAIYIIGLWGTSGATPAIPAGAGSYSAAFGFDLFHE